MAAKPTKLIQVSAPPAADTSRLPVIRGSDQRAPGLQGTLGPFVTGGIQGAGLPLYVAQTSSTSVTLTPDQLIGGYLSMFYSGAGTINVNFPSAASIVSYVGSDLARVRPGATPTNGGGVVAGALTDGPRIYESFDCYIGYSGGGTTTCSFGTNNTFNNANAAGTYIYGQGFFNNAAVYAISGPYTWQQFKVVIANSTPGSELVWITPV